MKILSMDWAILRRMDEERDTEMSGNGGAQRPKSCGREMKRIDDKVCTGLVNATSF